MSDWLTRYSEKKVSPFLPSNIKNVERGREDPGVLEYILRFIKPRVGGVQGGESSTFRHFLSNFNLRNWLCWRGGELDLYKICIGIWVGCGN